MLAAPAAHLDAVLGLAPGGANFGLELCSAGYVATRILGTKPVIARCTKPYEGAIPVPKALR
jgi:hypothetical protein